MEIRYLSSRNQPAASDSLQSLVNDYRDKLLVPGASKFNVVGLHTSFGDHSMVAVKEDVFVAWSQQLKKNFGVKMTLDSTLEYRIFDKKVLKLTCDTFDSQLLGDNAKSFPTPPSTNLMAESELRRRARESIFVLSNQQKDTICAEIRAKITGMTNLEEIRSKLSSIKLHDDIFRDYTVVETSGFYDKLTELVEVDSELYSRRCWIDTIQSTEFNVWLIHKDSPLIQRLPSSQVLSADLSVERVQHVIRDCFNHEFCDRSSIIRSFLDFLSRHYMASVGKVREYYSPLTCIHQSSGSGKSRLSKEILSFILPVIMSGPNPTGLPPKSEWLEEFVKMMLDTKNFPVPPHISSLMNVVHEFFRRVLSVNICVTSGYDLSTDGNYRDTPLLDRVLQSLSSVDSDSFFIERTNVNPPNLDILYGFKDYFNQKRSKHVHAINLADPVNSIFEPIETDYRVLSISEIKTFLEKFRERRISHLSSHSRQDIADELKWLPHVLIVLDEAQHLLRVGQKGVKRDLFPDKNIKYIDFETPTILANTQRNHIDLLSLIRRTLGFSDFFWKYCWATTISTSSSITNFTPTYEDDPSLRCRENVVILPPFIHMESFDVMSRRFKLIPTSHVGLDPPRDALVYLKSWQRLADILSCGRPLFYIHVEGYVKSTGSSDEWEGQIAETIEQWHSVTLEAFKKLYQTIHDKLNGGIPNSNLFTAKLDCPDLVYALMSSAVGLYGCPSIVSKEDLVSKRMGWVVSTNTVDAGIMVDFPSEGVFNILCAQILCQRFHTFFKKDTFSSSIVFFAKPATEKSFSTWQVTEILSRLLFLFAHKAASPIYSFGQSPEREPNYFSPRRFRDVLCQIAAPAVVDGLFEKLGSKFINCETYYGYFQECFEALDPISFCKSMLYRGSARYLPKQHPGADFVLPLVLTDGSYGLVLVQVKGLSEDLLDSEKRALEEMEKCTVFGVFGMSIDDKRLSKETIANREVQRDYYKDFPTVRILINLSTCGRNPNNGAKVVCEEEQSILVIQSDCTDQAVLGDEDVKWFFNNAISKAGDQFNGKMPKYEAQYRRSSDLSETKPFNPVYSGIFQDNDKNGMCLGAYPRIVQNTRTLSIDLPSKYLVTEDE